MPATPYSEHSTENVIAGWLGLPVRRQPRKNRKRPRDERKQKRYEAYRQRVEAATRAKYGPTGKPAPVTVKSLDGEVRRVTDQDAFTPRTYSDAVEAAARQAGFKGYADYLHSPHWLVLREQIIARDGHRCRRCGSLRDLIVHHAHYGSLGRENPGILTTLCSPCHLRHHA